MAKERDRIADIAGMDELEVAERYLAVVKEIRMIEAVIADRAFSRTAANGGQSSQDSEYLTEAELVEYFIDGLSKKFMIRLIAMEGEDHNIH